jgi:dTDP-4-dehydrorhamnose reductase
MRVLVTGAGGLVGGRLATLLSARFAVVAGWHTAPPPAGLPEVQVDLLSTPALEVALKKARPDGVVHAAALADADWCEREPGLAERMNVGVSEALAALCEKRGTRLVVVSTDLVFSGDRAFVGETDTPRPILVYGRTKLKGEEAALARAPGAAVVRVALVHGRGHGRRASASEAIAWRLRAGEPVALFTDQYRTPVDAQSVAAGLEGLLLGAASGIFHFGGPERLSRHALGLRVAEVLGLPAHLIRPALQAELPLPAPRPADVSLDCRRAGELLGWKPRSVDDGIREGRVQI